MFFCDPLGFGGYHGEMYVRTKAGYTEKNENMGETTTKKGDLNKKNVN